MPVLKKIENTNSSAVIWKISESQEELAMMIGVGLHDPVRLASIKKERAKVEWLAGRMALHVLIEDQNISFERLTRNDKGRPVLVGTHHYASFSHTKEYTAALLTECGFCGIDIETHFDQAHRIRKKYMTDDELSFAGDDAKKSALIWSAKESMYKAYGHKGLIFKKDMILQDVGDNQFTFLFKPLNIMVIVATFIASDFVMTIVCMNEV